MLARALKMVNGARVFGHLFADWGVSLDNYKYRVENPPLVFGERLYQLCSQFLLVAGSFHS